MTGTAANNGLAVYHSPAGTILIRERQGFITEVGFIDEAATMQPSANLSPLLQNAIQQIHEYFLGSRQIFELPLQPSGTPFQQTVWSKLLEIPYGKTATYMHIAIRLGNKKVIRAAAAANGKNPIGIMIPCHRVIGSDRKLTGYAGGLHRKQWLLEHEARFAGNSTLLF